MMWIPIIYTQGQSDGLMESGIAHRLSPAKSKMSAMFIAETAMKLVPEAISFSVIIK